MSDVPDVHKRSRVGTSAAGAPSAGASIAGHLVRGAVGFGLIGSALALAASTGPGALALAVGGMVALRGCPTCWIAGLVERLSAGRLERECTDGSCAVHPRDGRT
jgi:hypothetical protein